jgi:hypothetical protein
MPHYDDTHVAKIAIIVHDLGPEPEMHMDRRLFPPWYRYAAEVESLPAVREVGLTPWEAVSRLISLHRGLLERRWSPETLEVTSRATPATAKRCRDR